MFWETNRQALLQAKPSQLALLAALEKVAPTSDIELITTEDEDYTLIYRGIPLHAASGALKEAREISNSQCRPGLGRVHLVLGMGLGYLMEAVYQQSPGNIVVYEPDASLLRFVLDNVDLSEYLSSGRIALATSPGELLKTLHPLMAGEDPLDILVTQGYAAVLAPAIPSLMEQLFALADERLRDYQTGQHFHLQWIRQFFQNLSYFPQAIPFEALAERFPNRPALIIGRGPSLDGALEAIHAHAGSMVLIAAGGALRRLHEAAIVPDFAVFYDANGMREQLHGLPDSFLGQIIFLVNVFTEPCCFTAQAKSKVLFFPQNGEAMAEWLKNCQSIGENSKSLLLEGGGTVSLLALQAALAMRCNPVALVGQDLAFPGNRVYAGGIPIATDAQGRMALPQSETLYTAPEALTTVTGQNGEPLPALKAYAGFIRHFERIAAAHPETRLLNASLGGARLDGYALTTIEALAKDFPPIEKTAFPPLRESPAEQATASLSDLALRTGLTRLKNTLQQAIRLHKEILENHTDASPASRELFEFLNAHPLVSHCLMFEMMDTQRQYDPNAASPEAIARNRQLLRQNTKNCLDILQNQLLPWVLEAEQQLTTDNYAHSPLPGSR